MSYGARRKLEVRIKNLADTGDTLVDEKLKAELARLACVLAAGYVEVSCQEIIEAYAAARAEKTVASFVASQLGWLQNPGIDKILTLAGYFDAAKRAALESKVSDQLKDSIGSIIGNRNNIAHGRDSSITLGRLSSYYADARRFMAELEALFPSK